MQLTANQQQNIKNVLRNSLRHKFNSYKPEPAVMPFHTRLLGKDRMALFSFIHSLNTNFGTSIFEPVALALANENFIFSASQQTSGNFIYTGALQVIQEIMDDLSIAKTLPKKEDEILRIREVCQQGLKREVKPTKVDLKLIDNNDKIYLIDLKTAKPNAGEFKGFKRTLLEWAAVTFAENPTADIETLIAIPYNPYEPKPYSRWTMRGMIDIDIELKVASEFWDFLGGSGAYEDLLTIFEEIGIELRPEIDAYFAKFVK
ncbi:MAG: TdeIII family type II restriction endonuclease [bacterium]